MMARAAGRPLDSAADEALVGCKQVLAECLNSRASAILVQTECARTFAYTRRLGVDPYPLSTTLKMKVRS